MNLDFILLNCVEGKVSNNINDLLNLMNEQKLGEIYFSLYSKELKTNKNNLIKKITKKILNKDFLFNTLFNLLEDEFNLLENIINNNGVLQNIDFILCNCELLKCLGILYLINDNNSVYLIIPNEILEIVKELDLDKIKNQVSKNTRLHDLALSMINLYGIVRVEEYIENCIKYYNYEDINEINLKAVFQPYRFNPVTIYDFDDINIMTKEEFLDFGRIEMIESKYYDLDFLPEKKEIELFELLKYKELYYHDDNNEIKKLEEYFKKYKLNKDEITLIIDNIVEIIRIDYGSSMMYLKDALSEFNIKLNKKNFNELITLINNVFYNIPVWGSEGYTTKELLLNF